MLSNVHLYDPAAINRDWYTPAANAFRYFRTGESPAGGRVDQIEVISLFRSFLMANTSSLSVAKRMYDEDVNRYNNPVVRYITDSRGNQTIDVNSLSPEALALRERFNQHNDGLFNQLRSNRANLIYAHRQISGMNIPNKEYYLRAIEYFILSINQILTYYAKYGTEQLSRRLSPDWTYDIANHTDDKLLKYFRNGRPGNSSLTNDDGFGSVYYANQLNEYNRRYFGDNSANPDYRNFMNNLVKASLVLNKLKEVDENSSPLEQINKLTEAYNMADGIPNNFPDELQRPWIRNQITAILNRLRDAATGSDIRGVDNTNRNVERNTGSINYSLSDNSIIARNIGKMNTSAEKLQEFIRVNNSVPEEFRLSTNDITNRFAENILNVVQAELDAAGQLNETSTETDHALKRWQHLKNAEFYLNTMRTMGVVSSLEQAGGTQYSRYNTLLGTVNSGLQALYAYNNGSPSGKVADFQRYITEHISGSGTSIDIISTAADLAGLSRVDAARRIRDELNGKKYLWDLHKAITGQDIPTIVTRLSEIIGDLDRRREEAERELREAREKLRDYENSDNPNQEVIRRAREEINRAQDDLNNQKYDDSIAHSREAKRILDTSSANLTKINAIKNIANEVPNYNFRVKARLYLAVWKLSNGTNREANEYFARWGFSVTSSTTYNDIDNFARNYPNLTELCNMSRQYNINRINALTTNPQTFPTGDIAALNNLTGGWDAALGNNHLSSESQINRVADMIISLDRELNNTDILGEARLAFNTRLAILSETYIRNSGTRDPFRTKLQKIRWAGLFSNIFRNYDSQTGFQGLSNKENQLLLPTINNMNLLGTLHTYQQINILNDYLSLVRTMTGTALSDRAALMGTTVSKKSFNVSSGTLNAYIYTIDHRFHDNDDKKIDVIIQLDNGQDEIRINNIEIVNGTPNQTVFYLVRNNDGEYEYSRQRTSAQDLEINLAQLENNPLNIISNNYVPTQLGLSNQSFLGRQYTEIIAAERDKDDLTRNYSRPYRQQLARRGFIPALLFYESSYMNNDLGFWGSNSAKLVTTYLLLRQLGVSAGNIRNILSGKYTMTNSVAGRWLPGNNRYIDVAADDLLNNRRNETVTVDGTQKKIKDLTREELINEIFNRLDNYYNQVGGSASSTSNITESRAIIRRMIIEMDVISEEELNRLLR